MQDNEFGSEDGLRGMPGHLKSAAQGSRTVARLNEDLEAQAARR